jgi:hypothetical protein
MSTMSRDADGFAGMTRQHALFVRDLRVNKGYTWRMVADTCRDAWTGEWDWAADQTVGREICERAAAILGEDADRDPWN